MEEDNNIQLKSPPRIRLILGGIVFVSGFLSPLLIPWVLGLELSTGMKSLISGLLALGIPELFMIIAAGILGKEGFSYLKQKLFSILKKHGPPDRVSKVRYIVGLFMFSIPLFIGWGLPYFDHYLPNYSNYEFWIKIGGDIMLFLSLFVLGGDFWDKIRSLFVYNSKAVLIEEPDKKINSHDTKTL